MNREILANTASAEAFGLHEDRKRIDIEVVHQVMPKQTQPLILCLVRKLLTFLRTSKFELSNILQVMDHFVHQNR